MQYETLKTKRAVLVTPLVFNWNRFLWLNNKAGLMYPAAYSIFCCGKLNQKIELQDNLPDF